VVIAQVCSCYAVFVVSMVLCDDYDVCLCETDGFVSGLSGRGAFFQVPRS
jgi:hypothetical protein